MPVSTRLELLLGAIALAFNMSGSVCLAEPLQAHIEHTSKMSSVRTELRPGARFTLNVNETPDDRWIKIPHWLAGTWLVDSETAVYREDCSTGESSTDRMTFKARSKFIYGQQQDKTGEPWHYLGTPYTSATESSTFREYHQVSAKECVEKSAKEIALKTRVTVIRVDNLTSRVLQTFQQESITRYTYLSPTQLMLNSSTKVFDASGVAKNITKNEALVKRVEPFAIINVADGRNYRALFREFLTAQGLEDLIPDGV